MYEDKILVCKECGKEFTFTAGEQEFYAERGFQNEPQRCKACRDARKRGPAAPVSTSPLPALPVPRPARTGGGAPFPFNPKPARPLFYRELFSAKRAAEQRRKQKQKMKGEGNGRCFLPRIISRKRKE